MGDDADPAEPIRPTPVDDLGELEVGTTSERRHLGHEQPIMWRAGPEVDADRPEPMAIAHDVLDDRSQWRQPDAAGDDHDVAAIGRLDRPGSAERSAQ